MPSNHFIILCLGRKVCVFSTSTFELIHEIQVSSAEYISLDQPYMSNDDTNELFFHRAEQKGVDVCNVRAGTKEFKLFPNQDANEYLIYQGKLICL